MRAQTVLLVEDEMASAEMLRFVLQLEGFRVLTAGNGFEALACLQRERVDMILSDLMMPLMDGLELSRAVRKEHGSLPFILMSAAHDAAREHRGYDAFLPKPLDLDQVVETVKRYAATSPSGSPESGRPQG